MSRNKPNAILVVIGNNHKTLITNKQLIIFSESPLSGFKHVAF